MAALVAAAQLAIPRIAAARVHERLTRGGGSAEVTISALPATRLLRNSGGRIAVRGRDLEIGLAGGGPGSPPAGLATLDGFREVDIELVDLRTGPFEVAAFVLSRSGGGSYAMAAQATIAGAELARLGPGWLRSLPGIGLVGTAAGGTPLASGSVPVSIQVELISTAGGLRVGSGGGTIAGYPAGPIATTIAAAVARRLEIAP